MTTVSQRVVAVLVVDGLLDADSYYRIERTHAGREQKSGGAWSWYVVDDHGREVFIGSQWPASELLKYPEWEYSESRGGTNIDPVRKM